MLFFLTGDIQTGKTRWLQALVAELEGADVPVAGVLAPGVWRENPECPGELEKLGIDNLLLPQHDLITFGRRADLASNEGLLDTESQSAKAGLGWIFPDEALDTVNNHLASIGQAMRHPDGAANTKPGLLVIDELGQLELLRDGGLIEAMNLISQGPTEAFPHILVIVREWLLEPAHERFDCLWNGAVEELLPDEYSKRMLLSLYD